MTPTCLFTDVELGPDTKQEHTIPRSMGGRIVSREVSSSDFNNKCGSFCDDCLRSAYGLLLTRLAPLLPSASQPGLLLAIASDAPPGLVIEPGGILGIKGAVVVERDPSTGRPKKVLGRDEASLRRFAKRAQMSETAPIVHQPLTHKDVVTTHLRVVSPELELTALKSLLLSFDSLMSQMRDRFTRSQHLASVRALVRASIEERRVDGNLLNRYSLGIQLEKLTFYGMLRGEMQVAQTPFEHFMLVAGNRPQRCIDAVWVVFGFEPFGFRLCDRYDGPEFCYGLVNPVVKGRAASDLIELNPQDELLCRPTVRRSFQKAVRGPDDHSRLMAAVKHFAFEIATLRADAFDKAVYCIHTLPECEEWLAVRLRELNAAGEFTCMSDLIEARLHQIFPRQENSEEFKADVRKVLNRKVGEYGQDMKKQTFAEFESRMLSSGWLSVLRSTLEDLVDVYGLPGGGYFCDTELSNDQATWKQLGL